ncbi:ABC transporter substrate-binding protein [Thauera sinica]|uniref:ABC transporter substrate-binding protein n=1 Tax=Thauera sinica TaxID=2665146 RepID=A0ABW1AM80_9RHOO|nr:ABC transporter substrate-binding protein [Thauera sp. K11]ATE59173.1 nitrate ABC transporter substrate-binding protein [Thauera sp. K11]
MMNRMLPRRAVAWAGAVLALWLPLKAAQAAGERVEVVRIATVAYPNEGRTAYNGAAAVIAGRGWLEKDLQKLGIRLEWVPVPVQSVGASVNEAFANRSIDFAAYGDLPSVILNSNGVETRLIVPGGKGNNVYLVVPEGSAATSIRDLKGKRIALHRGRPWEFSFTRLLEANGLKLSDFKIANLNPQAGAAALAAGNVDAFVALSDAFLLADRGLGRIIWSTKLPDQGWKMRAELWGAKDFVERHPEIAQVVANAYVRAAHWISRDENAAEFIRLSAASGHPESTLRQEYADDSVGWKARWEPAFDAALADHYRHVAGYALDARLIRKAPDTDRLFDARFVRAALKELQLESYWGAPPAAPRAGR